MPGCVYHTITEIPRGYKRVFRIDVFRDGDLVDVDEFGEATFSGGIHVATLYRRHFQECHLAGINYSFRCSPDFLQQKG